MEGCTQVPVLVEELGGEAHDDVGCRALVIVAVALVNLSVGVAIDIHTLDRLSCLVIDLLIDEE